MRTKEQTAQQNRSYHQRHRTKILARQARNRAAQKIGADARLWAIKKMIADAKRRATARGMEFSLRPADIDAPDVCPVFGLPLEWARSNAKRTAASPSLDRIDSRLGYVPSNVWVISWRANQIKSDATPRELRAVARAVDAKLRSRRKSGGVIELPYLDGVQHAAFPGMP